MKPAGAPRHQRTLCDWLAASPRRESVITSLHQPLTARQLACRLGMSPDLAAYCFWELTVHKLTRCLNPDAMNNRLHWLTALGKAYRVRLHRRLGVKAETTPLPTINWALYGELLYRHRSAVLRAMNGPTQPSTLRKHAVERQSELRMSANNVRDVMRFLVDRGVATPVEVPGRAHTHYTLSASGILLRNLLLSATQKL